MKLIVNRLSLLNSHPYLNSDSEPVDCLFDLFQVHSHGPSQLQANHSLFHEMVTEHCSKCYCGTQIPQIPRTTEKCTSAQFSCVLASHSKNFTSFHKIALGLLVPFFCTHIAGSTWEFIVWQLVEYEHPASCFWSMTTQTLN